MMEQKSSLDQTSSESFFFFNPRTPCGVRHDSEMTLSYFTLFQSTHSLRSATVHVFGFEYSKKVSIHALLAECDGIQVRPFIKVWSFNPRTPCGVRRQPPEMRTLTKRFQSTHSLRSATVRNWPVRLGLKVSIHALLAECDCWNPWSYKYRTVSIHALLAECDWRVFVIGTRWHPVSIHALLAECDPASIFNSPCPPSFNPRTPCGVRLGEFALYADLFRFQSTHSLRSATCICREAVSRHPVSIHALLAECDREVRDQPKTQPVSIHALLAECDALAPQTVYVKRGFNPRTPCGVRPFCGRQIVAVNEVSIHALLAECDMT